MTEKAGLTMFQDMQTLGLSLMATRPAVVDAFVPRSKKARRSRLRWRFGALRVELRLAWAGG